MGRGIVYWIFQRPRFCCCLPVRFCVIIMALLGFLLSGVLTVILWFEVATANRLTSKERGAFIGGAIVEMLFFLVCSVGLIGVIVRKQSFVTAYTIGLYVHFLLNLGVAGYFLSVILHTTNKDTVVLCQHTITNSEAQDQCSTLFNVIRRTFVALASIILVIELYGAIVATRYVYQVRDEKRKARVPMHMRGESAGGGRVIPGFVRYDDARGTKVYSSYYYPPAEDHARGASMHSLASAEFEGATPMELYDPYAQGHARGASMYSLAGADFEGATPTELYDPYAEGHARGASSMHSLAGADFEGATPMGLYDPPAEGHARGASSMHSLAGADFEGTTPMGPYDPPTAAFPVSRYHEDLEFEDGYRDSEQEEHGYDVVSPPPQGVHGE